MDRDKRFKTIKRLLKHKRKVLTASHKIAVKQVEQAKRKYRQQILDDIDIEQSYIEAYSEDWQIANTNILDNFLNPANID